MNEGAQQLRVAERIFFSQCAWREQQIKSVTFFFLNSFTVRLRNTWPIFLENPQFSLNEINLYIPHINKKLSIHSQNIFCRKKKILKLWDISVLFMYCLFIFLFNLFVVPFVNRLSLFSLFYSFFPGLFEYVKNKRMGRLKAESWCNILFWQTALRRMRILPHTTPPHLPRSPCSSENILFVTKL